MPDFTELLIHSHGTIVTGKDLLPSVQYHGTPHQFESFRISNDLGFHFGSLQQAVKREKGFKKTNPELASAPWRIASVILSIRNPLILLEDPKDWLAVFLAENLKDVIGPEASGRVIDAHKAFQKEEEADPETARLLTSGHKLSMKAWQQLQYDIYERANRRALKVLKGVLEDAGFDGIAYWNAFERRGEASWVSFDPASIRVLEWQTGEAPFRDLPTPFTQSHIETSGYVGKINPMRPVGRDARAPNRPVMKTGDEKRVAATMSPALAGLGFTPDSEDGRLMWVRHVEDGFTQQVMFPRNFMTPGYTWCATLNTVSHDGMNTQTIATCQCKVGQSFEEFAETVCKLVQKELSTTTDASLNRI